MRSCSGVALLFQSTRPRGARPWRRHDIRNRPQVSIHAPAWGATPREMDDVALVDGVSIHAPAWGATPSRWKHAWQSFGFQSTRPRGARLPHRGMHGRNIRVSIHAPAWGATFSSRLSVSSRARFQSTRPRGARLAMDSRDRGHQMFQSTRPRGARPRPMPALPVFCGVSLHAPAWGATPCQFGDSPILAGFNPRARVGRDVV